MCEQQPFMGDQCLQNKRRLDFLTWSLAHTPHPPKTMLTTMTREELVRKINDVFKQGLVVTLPFNFVLGVGGDALNPLAFGKVHCFFCKHRSPCAFLAEKSQDCLVSLAPQP